MATSTAIIKARRLIEIIPIDRAEIINDNCDARVTVIIIATDIAANDAIKNGVDVNSDDIRDIGVCGSLLVGRVPFRRFRIAATINPKSSDIINCSTSA